MTQKNVEYANHLNTQAMALYKPPSPPTFTILSMLTLASKLAPDSDEIQANLGLVNWNHGSLEKGLEAYLEAVRLNPSALNHRLLAMYYMSRGAWKQAGAHLQEAISQNPDPDLRFDLAHLLLMQGDWANGLQKYEVRLESRAIPFPKLPYLIWDGATDLNGKTLYIQAEQGIGDHILFSRYLAWLKQEYPHCRILLCLYQDLVDLFWEFRDLVTFIPVGTPWPKDVDYGCFLFTLARYYDTLPYNIPPDPGFFIRRIATAGSCVLWQSPLPSLKVAICWTGNYEAQNNIARSIPLPEILRLAEDPRVTLYSVLWGNGRDDIGRYQADALLIDVATVGWVKTAVSLKEFDVIVTVCTGIAHLAGALGLNVWTLLSEQPYWIWPREGSTTPWYPSMRLFRQKRLNDWGPVINQVRQELSALADERGL